MLIRGLLVLLLWVSFGFSELVFAQDLEPRRWSHLPIGLNVLGLGYSYTQADIYFNPVLQITDGEARINSVGLSAVRSFDLAGKSARISFLLPYVSGRWAGNVENVDEVTRRSGSGDPRLRFSVNLYGAPALKGDEFAQYVDQHTSSTVVGASLAVTIPLGQYHDDELINIGSNRWSLRPQMGVVHTRGPWSFELTGSIFWFSDNNEFVDKITLKQKTMYAAQSHVTYTFERGLWVSASTGYGWGGRMFLDDVKTQFEVDNWLWAVGLGFPVSKSQSLKLTWLSGRTQNEVGRDSDNLLLSWATRWGQ